MIHMSLLKQIKSWFTFESIEQPTLELPKRNEQGQGLDIIADELFKVIDSEDSYYQSLYITPKVFEEGIKNYILSLVFPHFRDFLLGFRYTMRPTHMFWVTEFIEEEHNSYEFYKSILGEAQGTYSEKKGITYHIKDESDPLVKLANLIKQFILDTQQRFSDEKRVKLRAQLPLTTSQEQLLQKTKDIYFVDREQKALFENLVTQGYKLFSEKILKTLPKNTTEQIICNLHELSQKLILLKMSYQHFYQKISLQYRDVLGNIGTILKQEVEDFGCISSEVGHKVNEIIEPIIAEVERDYKNYQEKETAYLNDMKKASVESRLEILEMEKEYVEMQQSNSEFHATTIAHIIKKDLEGDKK